MASDAPDAARIEQALRLAGSFLEKKRNERLRHQRDVSKAATATAPRSDCYVSSDTDSSKNSTLSSDTSPSKNKYGEAVTVEDFSVQTFLFFVFKKMLPHATIVGEEQLAKGISLVDFTTLLNEMGPQPFLAQEDYREFLTSECRKTFPDDMANQTCLVIDPIDGSNNYSKCLPDYALIVSYVVRLKVLMAFAFMPASKIFMSATIEKTGTAGEHYVFSGDIAAAFKPHDDDNIVLAYGLGRRLACETREQFRAIIQKNSKHCHRFGCLTRSLLAVLTGEVDGYLSAKEEAFKFLGIWAIARAAQLVINDDVHPDRLSYNKAFGIFIVSPGFFHARMKPDSELIEAMRLVNYGYKLVES